MPTAALSGRVAIESFWIAIEGFSIATESFSIGIESQPGPDTTSLARLLRTSRRPFAHLGEIDILAVDFFASRAELAIGAGVSL